jgi:hypothetical protein
LLTTVVTESDFKISIFEIFQKKNGAKRQVSDGSPNKLQWVPLYKGHFFLVVFGFLGDFAMENV